MNLIATNQSQRQIALDKLTAYVSGARDRSASALNRIMSDVPQDRVVRAGAFRFRADNDRGRLMFSGPLGHLGNDTWQSIHGNAMAQIADRVGVPMAYVRHLEETAAAQGGAWARDLLASTFGEHFLHQPAATRMLVRSINGEARAVLSDKFRRIDCRPGLDALAQVATSARAIVADATVTATRVSVKFVRPEVLEPTPGEFVVFGLDWSNSDFGRGAQTLRAFVMRLFCWNGATLESEIRQIHLGGRLSDDVSYSDRTYALDAKATVSAIRDTAQALLGDESVKRITGVVAAAVNEKIDPKVKMADLRKRIGKGLADQVGEAFNRPDVEDLPPGNNAWRWSNALSWVAGHAEDPETRIDMERLAGEALKIAA